MTGLFLEKNLYFLNHRDRSEHNVKHFFADWELSNLASAMAISVLTDNQTTWEFAVDYFKTGAGNGAINNAVTNIVAEPGTGHPLGQGQESGRDQGHSALDFSCWALLDNRHGIKGKISMLITTAAFSLGTFIVHKPNCPMSNLGRCRLIEKLLGRSILLDTICTMMFHSYLTPMG